MPKQVQEQEEPELTRAQRIELRWKELQVEEMEERIAARVERMARLKADRERVYLDFLQAEKTRIHRQTVCKHRKGGRNNQFWNGDAPQYSIINNTYPTGQQCIMCSRCNYEVWKPPRQLKVENPEKYATMWAEWKLWSSYPTDNQPSGSKIFDIEAVSAA